MEAVTLQYSTQPTRKRWYRHTMIALGIYALSAALSLVLCHRDRAGACVLAPMVLAYDYSPAFQKQWVRLPNEGTLRLAVAIACTVMCIGACTLVLDLLRAKNWIYFLHVPSTLLAITPVTGIPLRKIFRYSLEFDIIPPVICLIIITGSAISCLIVLTIRGIILLSKEKNAEG